MRSHPERWACRMWRWMLLPTLSGVARPHRERRRTSRTVTNRSRPQARSYASRQYSWKNAGLRTSGRPSAVTCLSVSDRRSTEQPPPCELL
ncbi:MAG: hypothetical protein QN131_09040 [Armatimonadota bacterium]|nr:hypothetical protein [Armatimonadota bacterium]